MTLHPREPNKALSTRTRKSRFTDLETEDEQVQARQGSIGFSSSIHHHFTRAGGRTSKIRFRMTASARRAGIGAIGIVAAEYAVLLLVVTLAAHNENFWHELLETPRSRTGFIAYSAAFAIPAVAFALLARWRPGETSAKAFRIGLLVVAFLATIAAGTLLFAFCQSWDWKMSI